MLLVGLTGSVATGKSTVASLFQDRGAVVIDADVLARRVVEPDKPAWRDILRTFGKQVLRPNRALNREALARIVFQNRAKLKQLNAIVHPRVAREQARLTREIIRKDPQAVIIYDAPVLIEAKAHTRMDCLIVVTADERAQIARLQKRNRLTRAEAIRRIRSQIPLAQKVKLADFTIDGTLPTKQLARHVALIYAELRKMSVRGRQSRQEAP